MSRNSLDEERGKNVIDKGVRCVKTLLQEYKDRQKSKWGMI